jgi:hypothetical protein
LVSSRLCHACTRRLKALSWARRLRVGWMTGMSGSGCVRCLSIEVQGAWRRVGIGTFSFSSFLLSTE